jgi:dihydroorotase
MSFDLVLDGNIYLSDSAEIIKACIGIKDGKIAKIKKLLSGEKNLDFGYKLILPAGIDMHVHFREPGLEYKEDFFTGTLSAAFGGISYIADMPNTIPEVNSVEIFQAKLEKVKKKACIDFGLYASGISKEPPELAKYCTGFKVYMTAIENEKKLKEAIQALESIGKPILIHAEAKDLIENFQPKNLEDYLRLRPKEAEFEAVRRVISISKLPVHFCHLTTREALETLRMETLKHTLELTLHHLLLNYKSGLDAFGKVNPPLRTKEDCEELWKALRKDGNIIIASDHAPHLLEEKKDFSEAPPGMPGVETTYPILLYFVKQGKLSLANVVKALCERPAKLLDLKKGKLQLGYDADLIVIDSKTHSEIKAKNLHSKCGWSAFEGSQAIFPYYTFVRGVEIIEKFEFVGEKGFGKFIENV